MSKVRSVAVILLITLIGLIVGAEILFPNPQRLAGNYIWTPNFAVSLEPDPSVLSGLDDKASFSINELGIRTTNKDRKSCDLQILTIGGSTTECFFLDDNKAWPAILDSLFEKKHWVGNLGRSGLNTSHHILTLEKGLDQYGDLDCIIFLTGINDLNRDINQSQGVKIDQRSLFDQTFMYRENGASGLLGKLALVKKIKEVKKNMSNKRDDDRVQTVTGSNYQQWRENRKSASKILDTIPKLDRELIAYAGKISSLIDLCLGRDIKPIFLTQPSLYSENPSESSKSLCWMGGIGNYQSEQGRPYYSLKVLHQLLEEYNQVVRDVCDQRGVSFVDLAEIIEPKSAYFYDDCHFTNTGARLVAQLIYESIDF